MALAILNILAGLLTGFGAGQELVMRGILGGETQPFFVGFFGLFASLLFITSGAALWQKSPSSRSLAIVTATFSILFHIYAALPPHRNVRLPALIIGAGYGVVLLIITLSSKAKRAEASIL